MPVCGSVPGVDEGTASAVVLLARARMLLGVRARKGVGVRARKGVGVRMLGDDMAKG